ncbi:20206_t:CDS:2 [Dentiscutata erythropus]|uniref:20206_t:CDS:1 n=1 Tax=Dentiscutata erythropus TaxID=1348616 RepID=A0A9N9DX38_9GLOM|nr:20206_t:CDS:2 [Dentiscutata erythropus]
MNITCLKTLALNILKNGSPETIASGVKVPELDSCSICNEEIFLHILKKLFTVLTCGHTVHRLCLENLRETIFTCPVNNCSAKIEIIEKSPLMRALSQRSMSIDEGLQDSLIFGKNSLVNLDTIVEENSESGIPDSTTSNLPYKHVGEPTDKISILSERLEHHKKSNPPYASLLLVNKVKEQIPNIMDTTLWKKIERSRKIYKLFLNIKEDKIQRVRSFSALTISKLRKEDIDSIILTILKQKNQSTAPVT